LCTHATLHCFKCLWFNLNSNSLSLNLILICLREFEKKKEIPFSAQDLSPALFPFFFPAGPISPPAGLAFLLPAQSASPPHSHLQVGPTCRDLLQPPAHACAAARGPAPSYAAARGPPNKLGPHAENLRSPRRTRTKPVSPLLRAGLGSEPESCGRTPRRPAATRTPRRLLSALYKCRGSLCTPPGTLPSLSRLHHPCSQTLAQAAAIGARRARSGRVPPLRHPNLAKSHHRNCASW
jgi:hypothetical protein